jgi:N-acetylglucosaminyldiphosphoundecaprenol N-acetyl-beta-D-mannosaminyltransferase
MDKIEILGVKINNLSEKEVLQETEKIMEGPKQCYLVTPNPEFLVLAQKDEEFKEILNQADLAVPDGIGIIFASRFLKRPIQQRVRGSDLMEKICCLANQKKWRVLLLGGRHKVAEKTAIFLEKRYPGLLIEILSEENPKAKGIPSGPSVLFVAFGAPNQEKWIARHLSLLPEVKLAVGIGGSFDFFSGRIRRAPLFFQRIGIEWLWRLALEPWRYKRIIKAVVVFPWLILKKK